MHSIFNAYNKQMYSTERTILKYKMGINQAKHNYLTIIYCMCTGFSYTQCLGVT